MEFKLLHDANVVLAETPIWDSRDKKIYWTDLFEGEIFAYDPVSGEEKKWSTGKLIGSAIPCEDDSILFAALDDGMYRMDKATSELELIADPEPDNWVNRYNDTRIDATGRIFTSSTAKTYATPAYTPDQTGGFYMVERDGHVHTVDPVINQYNCIVWNADNTLMYVIDSYNSKLLVWDFELNSGPVGKPRVGIDFNGAQGTPDGMSIDVEGKLYICHWTGQISIWDNSLGHVEDVAFPVPQVCCGGFYGDGMKDFCVATAHLDYTGGQMEKRNGAGGLFTTRNNVAGRPDYFLKK